jgi:hypothetical protein
MSDGRRKSRESVRTGQTRHIAPRTGLKGTGRFVVVVVVMVVVVSGVARLEP